MLVSTTVVSTRSFCPCVTPFSCANCTIRLCNSSITSGPRSCPSRAKVFEKVPDAKTLARLGQLLGPEVIEELHKRIVQLAQENGVTQGQKLRVDTTVVETTIHYPTDSSLLGDGTRVLTRTMKKIEQKAGGLKRKVRDRMRSVRKRVLAIALSTRYLGAEGEARRQKQYRELLSLTRKTVNQAQRILEEVKEGPRSRRILLRGWVESLATMMGRVQQVVKQTRL